MKGRLIKLAGIILSGAILFTTEPVIATAEIKVSEERALCGFSYYLDNYYQAMDSGAVKSGNTTLSLLAESADIPENVAIANVSERLNIRSGPGTEYDIIGYLPKNGHCFILDDADSGWVQIKSGEVKGFVKLEYLYSGDEGVAVAGELGELKANITAASINLRSTPSTEDDSNIICVLSAGDECSVLEEVILNKEDDGSALWVKVLYDGQEGYLAKKYVNVNYQWAEAEKVVTPTPTPTPPPVTPEPVKEAEKKEEPKKETTEEKDEDKNSNEESSDNVSKSELRDNIISTAEANLGLRYSWGGTSLEKGADCSGFCLAVYRACGIDTTGFNRASYDIAVSKKGKSISRSELKKGDLIFYGKYGSINHVAMYYGDGKIIHESSSAGKSIISNMDYSTPMKYMNFLGD